MTEKIFDYMSHYGYEKVLLFQNEDVGLRAVLVIHSAALEFVQSSIRGEMK